jgi:hypothetical protein
MGAGLFSNGVGCFQGQGKANYARYIFCAGATFPFLPPTMDEWQIRYASFYI